MWKIVYNTRSTRVTAVNSRHPQEGESMIYSHPTQCAWADVYPERYMVVGGAIVERPEYAAEQAEKSRIQAFTALKERIVAKRVAANLADFPYLGTMYVSDEPNIIGVKSQIEGMGDLDPIPTFTGTPLASTWASAEDTFAPFNCGEFRAFAAHYYSHREKNFTNYTMLTIAATQAFSGGATVEELAAFDISQGWD